MRAKLSRDDIVKAINVAATDQFRLVVFTGGEATLRWKDLEVGISEAKSLGLKVRLVTNGWWGKSVDLAKEMVSRLCAAGLDEINFSTGDEHVKYVSLGALSQAVRAALDKNLDPLIMIEIHDGTGLTAKSLMSCDEFAAISSEEWKRVGLLESPWMPLDPNEISEYPAGQLVDRHNVHNRGGCDSIFSTHTLRPDKSLSICCGLGINKLSDLHTGTLGDTNLSYNELAAEAESDLLKLLIREIGPENLLKEVHTFDPNVDWEAKYAHKCQACVRVFGDPNVRKTVERKSDHFYSVVAQSLALDRVLQGRGLA